MNIKVLIFQLIILFLISSSRAAESQQEYVIDVPAALLYTEIPVTTKDDYQRDEIDDDSNVVAKLVKEEIVVEMPKDKGAYTSESCKKTTPFGYKVKYDWSLIKDWMCVFIKKPKSKVNRFSNTPLPNPLVFYTQDFPPYSYKSGDDVDGVGAAIVKEICKQAEISCEIELKEDWNNAQQEVKEGKAHGLFFLSRNKDREKWLNFSRPIVKAEYGFFVRRDDNWQFNTINDFQGKKIEAYGPSSGPNSPPSGTYSSLEALVKEMRKTRRKKNGIEIEMEKPSIKTNTETVLNNLVKGKIDIAYSNKLVGEHFIKRNQLKLKYANKHKSLDYYIAIEKSLNPEHFYNALDELIKNDIIRKKLTNYTGVKISEQKQIGWIYKLLLKKATD